MTAEIQVQKITDFSVKHPQQKLYRLQTTVMRAPFGFFYISSDVSSLIWQGSYIFDSLDQEAMDRVPSIIERRWTKTSPENMTETALVVLIFQTGELQKYNLTQPEQYSKYRSALETPDMITFARYDITQTMRSIPIQYSFTAENPRWSGTLRSELAIQLPRSQPWSGDLLEWVIEHHIAAFFYLREQLQPWPLADIISDLTRI